MQARKWISWSIAILPALVGIFCIILALLPYGILKPFADSLMRDGNFNSLKPWNAAVFKVLFGLGGFIFFAVAVLTGLRRWNLLGLFYKQLQTDAGTFFDDHHPRKDELGFLAALLVIMVLAVIVRLEYINSSLHHDEAYSFVAFAHSLFTAITDYHLPNNHVFHSILVNFSTSMFGIQPWAVRLPAFTAGVLLVPAVYWLAKRLYDRWTALGAALLVAWWPMLINYSTNARGYTLVALFTLLTLTLGNIVLKKKNLFTWVLIGLFSALGLYTTPVMLFPFGILFVWLLLSNQVEGPGSYRSKRDFLKYWLAAGLGTASLTMLLYSPILVYTGWQKVFENGFVAPLPWGDLLPTLFQRLTETWAEWTTKVPVFVWILIAAGCTLSLVFQRWLSTMRVPLQLAVLLWSAALILIQRMNAWAKVWLFLLPLVLMWAVAGIIGFLVKIRLKFLLNLPLAALFIGLGLLAGIPFIAWLVPQLPAIWTDQGPEEKAVVFIQSQFREGDLIIVDSPDDAPVWYYSKLHDIPDSRFNLRNGATGRYLVLVDPGEGQTPASVIAARGPSSLIPDAQSCVLMQSFGKMQIFDCPQK